MNVQSCIEAVKAWMAPNKLKMNDDKTEMMPVATSQSLGPLTQIMYVLAVTESTLPTRLKT